MPRQVVNSRRVEPLTPVERRFLEGWVDGMARFIARGPPEESPEEFEREVEMVKGALMEKGEDLFKIPRKWRARLMEVLAV